MPQILYVGDEGSGELVSEIATKSGYKTSAVGTLESAKSEIESVNLPFDLYFIDLGMTAELRNLSNAPEEIARRVTTTIIGPANRRRNIDGRVFLLDTDLCPCHMGAAREILPDSKCPLLRLDILITGVNLGTRREMTQDGGLRSILEHFRPIDRVTA